VHIDDADEETPLQEDDRTYDYSAAEAPGNDSSNYTAADAPSNDDDDFEDVDGATVSSNEEDDTTTSTIPPGMHCLAGSVFQMTEEVINLIRRPAAGTRPTWP